MASLDISALNESAATKPPRGWDRRTVLEFGASSAALGFSGLYGSVPAVSAEPLDGAVPELDALTVQVVTDSYQFAVAPSRRVGTLQIQHFGWGITPDHSPGPTLISEFGLSLHAVSRRGDEQRRVLVDFGYSPHALANNVDLLGIDAGQLDALVLSHGHFDHFGGLPGLLQKGLVREGTPFIVGGEDCFCAREWTAGPVKGDFGVLDRSALKEAKLTVLTAEQPSLVAGHGFTTGQINRASFEKLLSPSAMTIGIQRGAGCEADRLPAELRQQAKSPDMFQHEIATAFNLKGKGLVVLTSCSHRGVVNAIRQAQAVSGVDKVHAVIGGFHLAPYPPDYVAQTVAALKETNVDYIIPLHCSGEAFFEVAKAELGPKLVRAYTGTQLVFA